MSGVQFASDAALNYSPALSPTLSSYQGLSGSELMGLAGAQSSYSPTPPAANYEQAEKYVAAAGQATDPALQEQLLEQALGLLQPGGTSTPGAAPASAPTSAASAAASPAGSDLGSTASGLSVNGNSVNTGEYTITAGTNDDGSLTITNNQTGQSTEVWGDPHIKVNGQDTADFQNDPLNIQLQDGTTVHIDPTALQNGVSHIGQVSITKGDQSVTMGGQGKDGFAGGVTTSGVQSGIAAYQGALYNSPGATDITLGADGNLYHNNANGSMGAEITARPGGGETDLDGAGGGLVGATASNGVGSPASGSSMQQTMTQLLGMLSQNQDSFYSILMQQQLSSMMSQSGYAQA